MQGRDFLPQLFSLRGRDKAHPGSLAQCCPPAARLPLPTPTIGWPGRPSLPPGCCTGLSGHRLPKGREAHAVLVGDAQLGLAGGQLAGRAGGRWKGDKRSPWVDFRELSRTGRAVYSCTKAGGVPGWPTFPPSILFSCVSVSCQGGASAPGVL